MTKKLYMRPTFIKQVVGVLNKFGNTYYRSFCEKIDGVAVDALVEKLGSPLFVFSEKTIRQRYRDLYSAFSTRYPNVQFAWSYKTNYLGAVCSVLHQEGEIAEVVSEFEYEKARRLGIPARDIIFNGPYKPFAALVKAFAEGAIVNIDNFDELYIAEKAAKEAGKKACVGIRLNMDTGVYPQWSKFGFNIENGQAMDAVNRIVRSQHLRLCGLHAHIGTFMLEPKAYAVETEKMVKLMLEIESKFDLTIEYLDIGGGFPSKSRLKGIYLPPDVVVPNVEEYAEAVCGTLLRYLKPQQFPKLFIESGRALIDEAGSLISTVVAHKRLPDGTKSYVIDAGINLLYTSAWYSFSIQPDRQLSGVPEQCMIYGPLCMNIDIVAENVYLPPMPSGTRVVIGPVGAYNVTQWLQFITYRPAVAMVMEDGTIECIRRAERLEDVISCEMIPKKLQVNSKKE
jgi:diaminopimelate decarboxylase